jgi:glycyl-tRNA synthetase beta chain
MATNTLVVMKEALPMSDQNQYLLEIGTEELPSSFLLSAPGELEEKVTALLCGEGIPQAGVKIFATPRRLAILLTNLPAELSARKTQLKGPPARVALGPDGQPSQAGLGFARKIGIAFEELTQETIEGETYFILNKTLPGRPLPELLAERLPELVLSLSGSHFMAWGNGTTRFSRPIRWLLSLWSDQAAGNSQPIPLTIGEVTSGTTTRGHRVLAKEESIEITSPLSYQGRLLDHGAVVADIDERRAQIHQQLQDEAKHLGGQLPKNNELLETVTMLVEKPFVLAGRFEDRFLELPEEVTITVMAAHQKYFPVRDADGKKLLPYFLAVSNGRPESVDIIRHGNEKVIRARLEDARFFFDDDRKKSLEDRLEDLKGITFQKGLGSMYDKACRLEVMAEAVATALGYDGTLKSQVVRAARLAKADLVTGMVFEFTELQGAMGRRYAQLEGEPENISEAIFEHYLPRFQGDIVARNSVGIAVSLADKLDTMIAVFSQSDAKLPSGSKDPLGLRRMAGGLIQTVLENRLTVDLDALLRHAYQHLKASRPSEEAASGELKENDKKGKKKAEKSAFRSEDESLSILNDFILQRLRGFLLEQVYRFDLIDAVFESTQSPLQNLIGMLSRLQALKALAGKPTELLALYTPANRIARILGAETITEATIESIQEAHFRHPVEKQLAEAIQKIAPQLDLNQEPEARLAALATLSPTIAEFFESVMVNDPDAAVRKNRYNLLSVLNRFYLQLACFSKLAV